MCLIKFNSVWKRDLRSVVEMWAIALLSHVSYILSCFGTAEPFDKEHLETNNSLEN